MTKPAQYELELKDWRPIATAPRDATWVVATLANGEELRVHFAQDLSGEEQPAFSGWYYEKPGVDMFYRAHPKPVLWRPE